VLQIKKAAQHCRFCDYFQLFKTSGFQFRMKVCRAVWLLLHFILVNFSRSESKQFNNCSEQKLRDWKGKKFCLHFYLLVEQALRLPPAKHSLANSQKKLCAMRTSFAVPVGNMEETEATNVVKFKSERNISLPVIHMGQKEFSYVVHTLLCTSMEITLQHLSTRYQQCFLCTWCLIR